MLKTSLERTFEYYNVFGHSACRRGEEELIREFRRKVHQYVPMQPSGTLETLSLMQHYSAPTRLLDFTYSLFVAAFFCVERMTRGGGAVWAIDADKLGDMGSTELGIMGQSMWRQDPSYVHLKEFWTKDDGMFDDKLFHGVKPAVLPVNPFRLNERLTIQQGIFLCPACPEAPFMQNLAALKLCRDSVWKIVVPFCARLEFIKGLLRMNISRASLFPDIDGFAASVSYKLLVPSERLDKGREAEKGTAFWC